MEKLWNKYEVAEYLGLKMKTIEKMIWLKRIPCRRFNRTVRFVPSEIKAWGERGGMSLEEIEKASA